MEWQNRIPQNYYYYNGEYKFSKKKKITKIVVPF